MEEGKVIIFICLGILIGLNFIFFASRLGQSKKNRPHNLTFKEINEMDDEEFINHLENYLKIKNDYSSTPLGKKASIKVAEAALAISLMLTALFRR